MNILDINDLTVNFFSDEKIINAIDHISLSVKQGKTLCIVGESGCGKSVTALSILNLISVPPGKIESGNIIFENENILKVSAKKLKKIRGNKISMIFQEPMTSLNPVLTCGYQIQESLMFHKKMSKKESKCAAIDMLKMVKIPDPDKRFNEYPHQLSGGMRQRVMIAMALCCNPKILIADEPTTALDVTIQAQILDLIEELKEKNNMTVIFITHDLGVVAQIADEVVVFYAGKIAEKGSANDIFENAKHPYTQGLLLSVPTLEKRSEKLLTIPGTLPDPSSYPKGCRFYNRCSKKTDMCKNEPLLTEIKGQHVGACFHMDI